MHTDMLYKKQITIFHIEKMYHHILELILKGRSLEEYSTVHVRRLGYTILYACMRTYIVRKEGQLNIRKIKG